MSDYCRQKALRVPYDKYKSRFLLDISDPDDMNWSLEHAFPNLWGWGDKGKFQFAPTETAYIDYVLDYEYGSEGDWGKVRELYDSEKEKYAPIFAQIIKDLDMNDARLVEYSYWNATDAPDYFDITQDRFYDPV